jgi:hypothetical protein
MATFVTMYYWKVRRNGLVIIKTFILTHGRLKLEKIYRIDGIKENRTKCLSVASTY